MLSRAVRRGLLLCSFARAQRQKDCAGPIFDAALNYEHHLVISSTNITDVCRADLAQEKEF